MKLCVALDLPSKKENIELVKKIKDCDLWLKVGLRSFIRDGGEFISELKNINPNFKIFLDLKLYDIPNTMADAAESISNLGVDMFNVHASSGKSAMSAVMDRVGKMSNPPIVLAVTALTSFSDTQFKAIYKEPLEKKVIEFARDSYESGLNGVVCSVYESLEVKKATTDKFITLTPGIRPFRESNDDQQRVADLGEAWRNSCDFIVVGRPIYRSENPLLVTQKIIMKIKEIGC